MKLEMTQESYKSEIRLEDILIKCSHTKRRAQIEALVDNQDVDALLEMMKQITEQAYIAGLNRISLDNIQLDHQGYTGDLAVLVKNFLKDKGLC